MMVRGRLYTNGPAQPPKVDWEAHCTIFWYYYWTPGANFRFDLSTCRLVIIIGEVAGMPIGVLSCALDVFVGVGFADVSEGIELCPWWNQNTWSGGNEAFFPNGIIRSSEHVSYVWVDAKAGNLSFQLDTVLNNFLVASHHTSFIVSWRSTDASRRQLP